MKTYPVNIEEAKKLADIYFSITKEEIEQAEDYLKIMPLTPNYGTKIMIHLTGFSNSSPIVNGEKRCQLCIACNGNCSLCVYSYPYLHGFISCIHGIYEKSYYEIKDAQDPEQLLSALEKRGVVILELVKKIEDQKDKDYVVDLLMKKDNITESLASAMYDRVVSQIEEFISAGGELNSYSAIEQLIKDDLGLTDVIDKFL